MIENNMLEKLMKTLATQFLLNENIDIKKVKIII